MKLAKTSAILLAVLAISLLSIVPAVGAQSAAGEEGRAQGEGAARQPSCGCACAGSDRGSGAATAPAAKLGRGRQARSVRAADQRQEGTHGPLPPGKAGLVIATVRVDGAVRSASGMIAVVSNEEQRVYFIREGDQLYDGDVEKIGLDGVTFKENSKDAFGKPVERMVTKRIYASAGEQQ